MSPSTQGWRVATASRRKRVMAGVSKKGTMGHSSLEECNEASRSAARLSWGDSRLGDPAWQPLSLVEPLAVKGSGVC